MRLLLRAFAVLALLPYVGVVLLLVTGSASWSSVLYVIAIGVLLGGLSTLPDPPSPYDDATQVAKRKASRRPRGLSRGAVIALASVAMLRCLVGGHGHRLQLGDGASGSYDKMGSSRFVNRLVDEGDVAVNGTRVLVAGGMLQDDRAELPRAMASAYRDLKREEGDVPTPFVATYLGLEGAGAFDLVMIDPEQGARPTGAIVFLHGYAGNFDLPCWQVAHAVVNANVITACPSTRYIGDWWSEAGEKTLRHTVDVLKARGVTSIVLAGLSNGGYGASELAPRMKGTFSGLVLISGAERDAPPSGIPTLVIHGTHDSMASFEDSRRYATRNGAR